MNERINKQVNITKHVEYWFSNMLHGSGVTESLFLGPKRGPDFHLGVQEDGIAMKGAQSKVKWGGGGANGGPSCEWGGGGVMAPQAPHSYATAPWHIFRTYYFFK